MLLRRHARLNALPIIGLLVVAAGCQTLGVPQPDLSRHFTFWRPKTPGVQADPLPTPNERQKLNLQMQLAASLEQQGDQAAAIGAYQKILRQDAQRHEASHRLAVLYDEQGDHEQAAGYYEQAIKHKSSDPELLCDYGYSLYLQGRFDAAEKQVRKALELRPHMARAHNNLAVILARTGRSDEALAEFARGGCNPVEARLNLAHSLMWDKRWEEAEEHLQIALHAEPSSAAGREVLARIAGDSQETQPQLASDAQETPPAQPAAERAEAAADVRQARFVAEPQQFSSRLLFADEDSGFAPMGEEVAFESLLPPTLVSPQVAP